MPSPYMPKKFMTPVKPKKMTMCKRCGKEFVKVSSAKYCLICRPYMMNQH